MPGIQSLLIRVHLAVAAADTRGREHSGERA
ncbi:MAG: hypothetical protein JWM47_4364 [Acidimicrobiales bacterium]|nr:hypothetical protein [Acidimicrobiales bacterium]